MAVSATTIPPDWKGAYLLLMRIGQAVRFASRSSSHVFEPGWYAYAGSAYGPGGIGARLRRHFRRDKKLHWHVDRLTEAADGMWAIAIKGGSECAVVSALNRLPGFEFPLDGFGSSDCANCRSHLLKWRP